MADKYWVGGSGTWNSTSTANWSTSSGGPPGVSAPGSSDRVFFDNNSGASGSVVTIDGAVNFNDFFFNRTDPMAFAGSADLRCYGNELTIVGTITFTNYSGTLQIFGDSAAGINATLSSTSLWRKINVKAGIDLSLTLPVTTSYVESLSLEAGALVRLGANTRVSSLTGPATGAHAAVSMASLTGADKNLYLVGSFPAAQGKINFRSFSGNKVFLTGQLGDSGYSLTDSTIDFLEISPVVSNRTFKIGGSSTVTTLNRATGSLPFTLQVEPTANFSVDSIDISGDSSTTISVRSSVEGVRASIRKNGGGVVSTNYMNVKDMQPYPDNTWISYNSTNAGNNWQWYFDNFTKPTSSLFFGNHV